MRWLAGILLALLVMAATAAAAVRDNTDRKHGVVFHLDGRVLTVTLLPQVNPKPENKRMPVDGRRVVAACATRESVPNGELLFATKRWPTRTTSLKFRFRFNDSARMHYCALADLKSNSGNPIASVYFRH
jgi:hypothetical protein